METRPLLDKTIDQLEECFHEFKSSRAKLHELEQELVHRTVPRAVALRYAVARELSNMPTKVEVSQDELFPGGSPKPDV